MTTSPAPAPSGDAVASATPPSRSRMGTPMSQGRGDPLLARTEVAARQAAAVAKTIEASAGPRSGLTATRAGAAPPPSPTSTGVDEAARARARAAEAELRAETAAYEGVRRILELSHEDSARRERSSRGASKAREEAPSAAQAREQFQDLGDEEPQRSARAIRAEASEVATRAQLERIRVGLAELDRQAIDAAAEELAQINDAAQVVAQENAARRSWRGNPARVPSEELGAALRTLTDKGGATWSTARDGTVSVTIAGHEIVTRASVRPLQLSELPDEEREPPRTPAASTALETESEDRVQVRAEERTLSGIGGLIGGLLRAVNTLVPQAQQVIGDIVTIAGPQSGHGSPHDAGGAGADPGQPQAAALLAELTGALRLASERSGRRLDTAAAVSAILGGPPAGYYAGLLAAEGEPAPAGVGPIASKAAQALISDLQGLAASIATAGDAAALLAHTHPFIPISVTSSNPDLVRVDNPWPVPAAVPDPEGRAGAWAIDPDILTSTLNLDLSVVEVAHGDILTSRMGLPAGADATFGVGITVALGTHTLEGGLAADPHVQAQVHVEAPASVGAIAEAINAAGSKAGWSAAAGTQIADDGRTHLLVESTTAGTWLGVQRADGSRNELLGGFTLLAPSTQTVVVSTSNGLGWTGMSADTTVDGPLPGLAITVAPEAQGKQVSLQVTPMVDSLVGQVESFFEAMQEVLDRAAGIPAQGTAELAAAAGAQGQAAAELAESTLAASSAAAAVSPAELDRLRAWARPVSVLAQDSAVTDLRAAFAEAITATGAREGRLPEHARAVGAFAGLTLRGLELHRQQLDFERDVFTAGLQRDPVGTRRAVRAAAAEVSALSRETLDGRVGLLGMRLHTELAAARAATVPATTLPWGREQRRAELSARSEMLSHMLDRLTDQSTWFTRHLS